MRSIQIFSLKYFEIHLNFKVRTTGGTAKGAECKFPFTYNGTEYKTCINREVTSTNEEDDETVTYAKFCLTEYFNPNNNS